MKYRLQENTKKNSGGGVDLFCVLFSEDKGRRQASQGKETTTEKSTNRERGKEFGKEIPHRAWMFVMCLSVVSVCDGPITRPGDSCPVCVCVSPLSMQ
jgi:hypothetical protein